MDFMNHHCAFSGGNVGGNFTFPSFKILGVTVFECPAVDCEGQELARFGFTSGIHGGGDLVDGCEGRERMGDGGWAVEEFEVVVGAAVADARGEDEAWVAVGGEAATVEDYKSFAIFDG